MHHVENTIEPKLKKNYTISEILTIIKKGVLLLTLTEYYEIKPENIVGAFNSKKLIICFKKEGFSKVLKKHNGSINPELDSKNRLLKINDIDIALNQLSSHKIFEKFPKFWSIIDIAQYKNINLFVNDSGIVAQCIGMQNMWGQWGSAGLPHLISSHQTLQRFVASKMSKPLACDFDESSMIKNGLSAEYQCEIYAKQLYGAKLLDIWHDYLISDEPEFHHPTNFLTWLKSLPHEKLQQFDINDLQEIPKVKYMRSTEQRQAWRLSFKPGNIVIGDSLPKPLENHQIEIIYTLGISSNRMEFYAGCKQRGYINHSSFFGGARVNGAGWMTLKSKKHDDGNYQWFIHAMDNNSGHIKPDDEMTRITLMQLIDLGVELNSIQWHSKYGTIGQRGETAAIALKRLTHHLSEELIESQTLIQSKRINKIREYSIRGELKTLYNYLSLRLFKIDTAEALAVALLIHDALSNSISYLENGLATKQENPKLILILANQAISLMKNVGVHSQSMENKLENIINRYASYYPAIQKNVSTVEKLNPAPPSINR